MMARAIGWGRIVRRLSSGAGDGAEWLKECALTAHDNASVGLAGDAHTAFRDS